MQLFSDNEQYKLYNGNMLDMLEVIEPNSIDSIITDPPYELNFMGKGWDNAGVSFQKETWEKCFQVLKSGGYLLAFGGSRTFHRIACAIEDAGFEIRDTIMWLYGSGFPKSMNIGLAIDKKLGNESKVVGIGKSGSAQTHTRCMNSQTKEGKDVFGGEYEIKKANNEWNGWGTCLKPSFEPIIVARKPFKGSLVDNVLENGVGGINIDECRVETNENIETGRNGRNNKSSFQASLTNDNEREYQNIGRFPANTILTYDDTDYDEVCGGFPITKSGSKLSYGSVRKKQVDNCYKLGFTQKEINDGQNAPDNYGDSGSASRYFYCAKASKKDRDEGLNVEKEEYMLKEDIDENVKNNIKRLLNL